MKLLPPFVNVPLARQALRKLIPGRIEFRPVVRDGKRGYHLRWTLAPLEEAQLRTEIRMTIKVLAEKGCGKAEMSRLLGIPESNVRYHLKRITAGVVDRRARLRRFTSLRGVVARPRVATWIGVALLLMR